MRNTVENLFFFFTAVIHERRSTTPNPADSAPLLPKQCVFTDPSFRRHPLSDGVSFRTSPPPGKAAAAVKEMKTAAEQHEREGEGVMCS